MTFVYKYLDADRSSFLVDGLIRFTPPGALNDPYECLPSFPENLEHEALVRAKSELFARHAPAPGDSRIERRLKDKTACKEWAQTEKILRQNMPGIRERFMRTSELRMNSRIGILSLSSRWDSALMWSHYARSYAGFCIGFNREHPYFRGDPNHINDRGQITQVMYSAHRTKIKVTRFTDEESYEVLLTKSLDWEYEKEERMVALLDKADKTIDAAPYPVALFQIPFDAMTEIIVGNRASLQLKTDVLAAGNKFGLQCFETQISRESFDVERRKLVLQ